MRERIFWRPQQAAEATRIVESQAIARIQNEVDVIVRERHDR